MELSERCIAILEVEGFDSIDEQHYPAHAIRPIVTNPSKTAVYVTEGTIVVTLRDSTWPLAIGERITIPANTPFSILVGSALCQLVVGEITD